MGDLTFLMFMDEVRSIQVATRWRPGQALFNHLQTVHPMIADSLRGSNFDPFYASSTKDPRFIDARNFIERYWDYPIDKEIADLTEATINGES